LSIGTDVDVFIEIKVKFGNEDDPLPAERREIV
jgi:hypothetical protein